MKIDKLFDENLRQTGRTTKMLKKAKELAEGGRAVYIISANDREQKRIAKMLGNKNSNPYDNNLGIKVETPSSPGNFCWETLSLRGAHSNCIVLVDHYAIEQEIIRRLSGMEKAINSLIP